MDAGTFFNRLAMAMRDNPPYAEDTRVLARLKELLWPAVALHLLLTGLLAAEGVAAKGT
jgi:hypothetical protein